MDPRRRGLWKPRILFLAVAVILTVVETVQYQWFRRSAETELQGTMHRMEAEVHQTVSREYQRYAPLFAEIDGWNRQPLGSSEIRRAVTRLWATYGPGGSAPDLLAWVGWGTPNGDAIERLGPQGWTRAPVPPTPTVSRLTWSIDSGETSRATLVVRTAFLLYLGVDSDRFFGTYVGPALLETFPGSKVTWAPSPHLPPPGGMFDPKPYEFNPFTALWEGPTIPPQVVVEVPRFPNDLNARMGRSPGGPWFPDVPERGFVELTVALPAETPAVGLEHRLAWNFLGSTLLLVVLGATFGLTLRQANRLAALRAREREFVASVSHELRTPLTVIRSAADNFVQGVVPPGRQIRYGELILDQSLRLGRMIEEMLCFARSEAVARPLLSTTLAFGPWLEGLQAPLEALAAARQVALTWSVEGLPAEGTGDPEGLRLLIENLVINAINHAYPPGPGPKPVTVSLGLRPPGTLRLTVEDEGRGIGPSEAKKVFEPFYRDEISRNAQEPGSGLGLFLAFQEARRQGGKLTLESPWRHSDGTRRPGCRFVVTLPWRGAPRGENHGP